MYKSNLGNGRPDPGFFDRKLVKRMERAALDAVIPIHHQCYDVCQHQSWHPNLVYQPDWWRVNWRSRGICFKLGS